MLLPMIYKTTILDGITYNVIAVDDGADGVDFILEPVDNGND